MAYLIKRRFGYFCTRNWAQRNAYDISSHGTLVKSFSLPIEYLQARQSVAHEILKACWWIKASSCTVRYLSHACQLNSRHFYSGWYLKPNWKLVSPIFQIKNNVSRTRMFWVPILNRTDRLRELMSKCEFTSVKCVRAADLISDR